MLQTGPNGTPEGIQLTNWDVSDTECLLDLYADVKSPAECYH